MKTHKDSGVMVEIMIPTRWWRKPMYKLTHPVQLSGVTVPIGFVSDGATVPRILWPIFPPIGRYLKATLVHDYLLSEGVHYQRANWVFKQALEALGIQPWRVWLMYQAVNIYQGIKALFKS